MIPGAYKISFEDYLSDNMTPEPSLSRSGIVDLLDCPRRAFINNRRLNPPQEGDEECDEDKFSVGVAAHSLLLEGIDKAVVVDPKDHPGAKGAIPKGWTTNEMKDARDAIRAAGKIPLLPTQYKRVCGAVEAAKQAIRECSELGITDLQAEGDSELSYIWEEAGIWLRIRPDWISKNKKLILDFKTSSLKVSPMTIGKHIAGMGYEVQEALYRRGVKVIDGTVPSFIFIFQEVTAPYFCSFIALSSEFQEMGEQKVKRATALWKDCLSTNVWPGYPNRVCCIDAPSWSLSSWEMEKYAGGEDE